MTDNRLNYVKGDATTPLGEGKKYIVHICNDIGGWGAGFVVALSKRWIEPERSYRLWYKEKYYIDRSTNKILFDLGNIQEVPVTSDISVINMIAQHNVFGMKDENGNILPPIRYDKLRRCLNKVAEMALKENASVHMPKIGAGLAGGKWNIIEGIINDELVDRGIKTTVYIL